MMDFLDDGGSLYIETSTIGTAGYTDFYPYLGLSNNSIPFIGYSLIEYLDGDPNSFLNTYSLNYMYGSTVDYGNDTLDPLAGSILMQSQEGNVRTVYHAGDDYRTITSSIFFGSLVDGNFTKAQIMEKFLIFMSGDPAPNIWVEETFIDFGIQFAGYPAAEMLRIVNTGLETLSITDITIEGDSFEYTGPASFEILSSEEINLEIVMNAQTTGIYVGTMTIFSNDPDQPEVEIELNGNCVQPPILEYDPDEFTVEISQNQTDEQILTLSNLGGYDLEYTIDAEGIGRDVPWLQFDPSSGIVSPYSLEDIILTFDANSLAAGSYEAEIFIEHNDPAQDLVSIPVLMTVQPLGTGNDLIDKIAILKANYPNPFNPTTTIEFDLNNPNAELTELTIFNSKGQKVKTLVQDYLEKGFYSVIWNGKNDTGEEVPSGIYYYKIRSGSYTNTRKMILVK